MGAVSRQGGRYPEDAWFHLRLEVVGPQAKLYVKDRQTCGWDDRFESGMQKGSGFWLF